MLKSRSRIVLIAMLLSCALLAACGGNGGGQASSHSGSSTTSTTLFTGTTLNSTTTTRPIPDAPSCPGKPPRGSMMLRLSALEPSPSITVRPRQTLRVVASWQHMQLLPPRVQTPDDGSVRTVCFGIISGNTLVMDMVADDPGEVIVSTSLVNPTGEIVYPKLEGTIMINGANSPTSPATSTTTSTTTAPPPSS